MKMMETEMDRNGSLCCTLLVLSTELIPLFLYMQILSGGQTITTL